MNNTDKMMYGCDIEAFKESIKDSFTYKFQGGYMVLASLLSDAQEQLAHGQDFGARQTLNKAKALLFLMADGDMTFDARKEDEAEETKQIEIDNLKAELKYFYGGGK